MDKNDSGWCPTHGGSLTGYRAEFEDCDGTWKEVTAVRHPTGIPGPKFRGDVLSILDMQGYEQAMALAWCYAACEVAQGIPAPKVRVQAYEVVYDVKARKTEAHE